MQTTLSQSFVIEEKDKLSHTQKTTFLNESCSVVLIETGDVLWRFISQKNRNKFSDFWMDSTTMGNIMSIFRSWEDYSENTKKQTVRNSLAILDDWSKLSWRVKINFKVPIIAYKGPTGPQKLFDNSDKAVSFFGEKANKAIEHRIGGYDQYVIPRFKGISDEEAKQYAEVTHFSHI